MESSPKEDGGRQFYSALGDLKLSPSQMEDSKFFILFFFWEGGGDNRFFSTREMGGVSPQLPKNLLIPTPPGKVPPSRLPVPNPDKKSGFQTQPTL